MAIVAAIVFVRSFRKTPTTGLVLAYVFNLWLIHWLAPSLYLLPAYQGSDT